MNILCSVLLIALPIAATRIFSRIAKNTRLMDKPNERSLHSKPTVRGGGLVFIGLFLLSLPVLAYFYRIPSLEAVVLFISVFSIAFIGFCDDMYNLSSAGRFVVQCFVAGLVSFVIQPLTLNFILFNLVNSYLIFGFTFFVILGAINHFNFMDGLDGFCGSQALFLFVCYAFLFGVYDAFFYQDLCWVLIFGLMGFLFFNFPPAKLFMGDVGSATLGFISFYMALVGQQKYQIPILYWFILNGLFLFDSTLTLLRRIYNKEQWFAAHRKHAYQRLKLYGISAYIILIGQLGINIMLFIGVCLIQKKSITPSLLIAVGLSFLIVLYGLVEKLNPMSKV